MQTTNLNLKEYILTTKYINSKGKVFNKGDKISLNPNIANQLENAFIDPQQPLTVSNVNELSRLREEVKTLKHKNKELRKEIQRISSSVSEDSERKERKK